jgi:hypothetical protein
MRMILASLLVLAACDGANTTVAGLPGLFVTLIGTALPEYLDDELHPSRVDVELGYNVSSFRDSHDGACATVGSDTGARLDDTELELVDQGESYENEGGAGCLFPTLQGDFLFRPGATHTLVVGDDTATVTAEYAAASMEPAIATLRSHPEWRFRAGDQVVVGWPRPQDLAPLETTFHVGFYLRGPGSPNHFDMPFQVVGDELHFQFPATLPVSGEGDMKFEMTTKRGPAVSCEGATGCPFSAPRTYRRRAFVDPTS